MPQSKALAVPLDKEEKPKKLKMMIALVFLTIWTVMMAAQVETRAETSDPIGKKGKEDMEKSAVPDSLLVVWTSGDREVAQKMVFMYCKNSKLKNWWSRVRLVIWGPSAQLLAKDKDLQNELEELKAAGVELQACKACADLYGVTDQLRSLGIEVIYMGAPLTEMLKTGWTCLTF
ncbi:MAG: DsrE family protein [Desulfobaccales bacterium]